MKELKKMNKMLLAISTLVVFLLDPHVRVLNAETDPDIDIRLRYAIVNSDTESVINFLSEGASANRVYEDGVTPLGEAIVRSGESIEIVKVLMNHGADPKVKSSGGSLLSLAKAKNNEDLIRFFYQYAESDAELYELALFYWNKEKELMALEYADETLKLNPFNGKAWALKGRIYLSDYYYNRHYAETAYRKAYEASLINLKTKKSADNYTATVWYAILSSDFNEALRVANEGLSLFPADGNLRLHGAHAMLLLGRKKEAIDYFKKAYADLQRSERDADRVSQMIADEFADLMRRYPDKASELRWVEEKTR
jgi:tetratricopeptide (TPR) repeat protein